jgi:hypothetical protein
MATQKLSSLVKTASNRLFSPDGFIDKSGKYVPLVRPKDAKRSLGLGTVGMIQDNLLSLGVDEDTVLAVDIIAAAYEAIALEDDVRAAHATKEAAAAKAAAAKAKADEDESKAYAAAVKPTNPPVRKAVLSSFSS